MKLERQQILSLFIKVMKKFYKYLNGIASKEIDSTLRPHKEVSVECSFYFIKLKILLFPLIDSNYGLSSRSKYDPCICRLVRKSHY